MDIEEDLKVPEEPSEEEEAADLKGSVYKTCGHRHCQNWSKMVKKWSQIGQKLGEKWSKIGQKFGEKWWKNMVENWLKNSQKSIEKWSKTQCVPQNKNPEVLDKEKFHFF